MTTLPDPARVHPAAPMTDEARAALKQTVQDLRARLIRDLGDRLRRDLRLDIDSAVRADLSGEAAARRKRLQTWLDEQVLAALGTPPDDEAPEKTRKAWLAKRQAAEARLLDEAITEAGATWLHRLVLLRQLEAHGLRPIPVLTGGFNSPAYQQFRDVAPALCRGETEGLRPLLGLVISDLALELPGLFGSVGLVDLVRLPAATLRELVTRLDDPALASCWTDDMTLGWVYQYWNDPARDALDAKLNEGGKLEHHEIASKTQLFTERYMVDWLLQNTLGPMWLATCRKQGWTPEVVRDGVLDALEARRVDWRAKREAGEVDLTAMMPLHTDAERRWAWYVPQDLPADAVTHARDSVKDWQILDPACGSGHFLVVAVDLLVALLQEEARHRGCADDPAWQRQALVEYVLSHTLHGLDIDPRAVQIASAALWLKGQTLAPGARPATLHLVASRLRLAGLPEGDDRLTRLVDTVEAETGLPASLMRQVLTTLAGADHLGTLLQVEGAIDEAFAAHAAALASAPREDGRLYVERNGRLAPAANAERFRDRGPALSRDEATGLLTTRLEAFLARHTGGEDLGLRLRGEQLAAGVRFLRLVQEGRYDLVVGNPPYQGASKLADKAYIQQHYPRGKADLFACFLERGLQLARPGGYSALLTMRNWMFIKQYKDLREGLLEEQDLRLIGDLAHGAFRSFGGMVVSVAMTVFRKAPPSTVTSTGIKAMAEDGDSADRKRAALLAHVGRHDFDPEALRVVPTWPLTYWWTPDLLNSYGNNDLIIDVSPAKEGITTGDNTRFRRSAWEATRGLGHRYIPFVAGAAGHRWIEPVRELIDWGSGGLGIATSASSTLRNSDWQNEIGVAFTTIGERFGARLYRVASVFEATGRSVFPQNRSQILCSLNTSRANEILNSLNPTIHFTVGDVNRLPLLPIANADDIVAQLDAAFTVHEAHREPSVEFTGPGPSPWRHAQDWAQEAVDRPEGAPLPAYVEQLDPEPDTDHVSFAVGVALGRFGPPGSGREGILDPATDDLSHALPNGILFLDGTDGPPDRDSLAHPACALLRQTWAERGVAIDAKRDLRTWLRERFFADVHKKMYDNRPIHWPLSSANKTFVAWITIHRWTPDTLRALLAQHLAPLQARLEAERDSARQTRDTTTGHTRADAERRFTATQAWLDELADFRATVQACAEQGPPPPGPKVPARAVDARYAPDLDDGVMINSAALWPLLLPQWKEPKTWWTELAQAKAKKDYDWSHLAMRYWPERVDAKCRKDPSLGVAHGCFWRYHPARAWAWELRLQHEIGPDFRIDEAPYTAPGEIPDGGDGPHREAWLREHAEAAREAVATEAKRRARKDDGIEGLAMNVPGLWSAEPAAMAALELQLGWDLGSLGFRLDAPDAEAAFTAWAEADPDALLAVVRAEAERRYASLKQGDRPTFGGLILPRGRPWDLDPDATWALEVDLSETWGQPIHLDHPGSEAARAAWMDAHPEAAAARRDLFGGGV